MAFASGSLLAPAICNGCSTATQLTAPGTNATNVPQGPIVQTADNKQWLDLDVLHPKLLKELRRQYEHKDERTGTLGKGAAKLKAFARHTRFGFDIRLRRKINSEQDEVTDIHLVAASEAGEAASSELPAVANEISEMPDTSVPQELDSTHPTLLNAPDDHVEPLPRYARYESERESPSGPFTETSPMTRPSHDRHYSQPGLEFTGHREQDRYSITSSRPVISEPVSPLLSPTDKVFGSEHVHHRTQTEHGDEIRQQRDEATQFSDGLQMLIDSLRGGRTTQQDANVETTDTPRDTAQPGRLRIASQETYETETDAAPTTDASRRRKAGAPKRKTNTSSVEARPNKSAEAVSDSEEEPQVKQEKLIRKITIPRKHPASLGAEVIWSSALRRQQKILGQEHPLVYRAKSDLAESRVKGHKRGASDLSSLFKTKQIAMDTMGTHPWVSAFIADLETLEGLLGEKSQDTSNETKSRESTPPKRSGVKAPEPQEELGTVSHHAAHVLDGRTDLSAFSSGNIDEAAPDARDLPKIVTSFHASKNGQSPTEASAKDMGGSGALWNAWRPPHRPGSEFLALPKIAFGAAMGALMNGILWAQQNYGPAPPVEAGKVRVRWTCSCGAQLYDDFIERRPGAARELEAYLNRPKTHAAGNGASPTSPHSSHPSFGFQGSSPGGVPSSQPSWTSYGSYSPGGGNGKKGMRSPQTYAGLPLYSQNSLFDEPPWLLTSANEDRHTPKISHLDMSPMKVRSDKDLALALREHYFTVNKKWWRSMRIRGLTTIEFVQFEVHQNRFADIRKSPDMPACENEEYSFEPVDLLPPVGSQYLLHLFKHPEDYDGELITYLRSPKKNGRLHVGVGWGIDLIEGFRADRVWLFVSGLFALGSLVFTAVWSHQKHNVQGASGVAAYIVSLGVLAIGWLQAFLG